MDKLRKIAQLAAEQRRDLFRNTSVKMGVNEVIVEKDFWVCWTLDYLFRQSIWKSNIAFKGGTSLSKCYGLIQRFSEDIDLILDWCLLGYAIQEPWESRTITQQGKFIKQMNQKTAEYLKGTFIPTLKNDFSIVLSEDFDLYIDPYDLQTICFDYPKCFDYGNFSNVIRLEIGTLSAWSPIEVQTIQPYAAKEYPKVFENLTTNVLTVSAERTFWEKVTILHKEAFRLNDKFPLRYSRHYYDLYRMLNSPIKDKALSDLNLLKKVVEFKSRFYRSLSARYDLAKVGSFKLIPPKDCITFLSKDYQQMEDMIFGEKPKFEEILDCIQSFENQLNALKSYS